MNGDEIREIINALKICQYAWADQVADEGQTISDYEAYGQVIKSLEEYADEA